MKQLILILILVLPSLCWSQTNGDKEFYLVDSLDLSQLTDADQKLLDSCLTAFHQAKHDTLKIYAINDIIELGVNDVMCRTYNLWLYDYLKKALKKQDISNTHKRNILKAMAGSLINIGYYSDNDGDIVKALNYYKKGHKLFQKIKDPYGQGSSLINIGHIYMSQGDADKALDNFIKSYEILSRIDDKYGMSASVLNIGAIYNRKGELDSALAYYEKGLALGQEIGNLEAISNSYYNIGFIYQNKGDIDKALEYFTKSADLLEKIGYKKGIASVTKYIGSLYLKQGDIANAKIYAMKSFEVSNDIGYPENIRASSRLLYKIYEKEKNYAKALEMYKLYIVMKDSLSNMESQKITAKQLAEYEYEKQKAIDDAEHEKQLAIEQEAAAKQQIITYATAGGLGLVGIFLLFVFNRLKVTRKQKGIIELAHHELEEKNQEIMDSITYAKRIQSAILPSNKVVKQYLEESFILYKPKDIVAGDFYWLEHKDNKVLFAAADCTGHGVPGAMVSVVCNNGLNRSVREHGLTDPGKILDKTRDIIVQEFEKSEEEVKDGMDVALCCLEGNVLHYAGAHNPLWIIRKGADAIEEIKADKQPIGQTDNPSPYTTHKVELNPGDTFYVFSDGYADQFGGEKGKKLKSANFKKLLLSLAKEDMVSQKALIDDAFEGWKGELDQLDDVCVIGVRI